MQASGTSRPFPRKVLSLKEHDLQNHSHSPSGCGLRDWIRGRAPICAECAVFPGVRRNALHALHGAELR